MKIKRLLLENIRSYKNEELTFKSGISLLSGDIGSGKTTTLLAIEFALFGLVKGKVTSDSVLRHGKNKGRVILEFELNNKEYTIKRTLSRSSNSSNSIKQESGTLITDGAEESLTPQELRARIVEILGYPSEFVSKSPAIIYRYTVYTPQEDMKLILFESPDTRLETIRKIFNIDKYKTIKNNISLYLKELNARIRENKAKTEDIDSLKQDVENMTEQKKLLSEKIKELKNKIELKDSEVRDLNSKISKLDERILEQTALKQKIVICKTKISSFNSQKESLNKQLISIDEKLKDKPEDTKLDLKDLKSRLEVFEKRRQEIINRKNDFQQKKAILKSRINDLTKLISDINELDKCPVCKQDVPNIHKQKISSQEKEKIASLEQKKARINELIPQLIQKQDSSEKSIKELQDSINQVGIDKLKIDSYNEKLKRKKEILDELKNIDSCLEQEQTRFEKFTNSLDSNLMALYDNTKDSFKQEQQALKELELALASNNKELEMKQENIAALDKQIDNKKQILKNIEKQKTLRDWLDTFFIGLMQTMERYVLNSILTEFNESFKDWFDMLIEDETISVRLDDSFSPLIEQNGHDTFIQNLSGGEKTSVALAYRLSLNKVINDFVSNIQTKGLLILDEPTDGFSSNQLDKLRDVLMQVEADQIIIVSHEQKLESYADQIVYIAKEHHVSSVV